MSRDPPTWRYPYIGHAVYGTRLYRGPHISGYHSIGNPVNGYTSIGGPLLDNDPLYRDTPI